MSQEQTNRRPKPLSIEFLDERHKHGDLIFGKPRLVYKNYRIERDNANRIYNEMIVEMNGQVAYNNNVVMIRQQG